MKKTFFLITCLVILLAPGMIRASESTCQGTWIKVPIPIVFDPEIKNPANNQMEKLSVITQNGRCIPNPAILMFMLFYLALVLMALVAIFMITLGGYNYLTAFGSAERAKEGKSMILAAIGGLVVGLLSYVLLDFINPDLTSFDWSTNKLTQEIGQSMEKIAEVKEEENLCPSNTTGVCYKKGIGDVCETSNGIGNCRILDNINIGKCTCDVNKCADNCDNGDLKCVGEKCKDDDANISDGQCLLSSGSAICMDIEGACGNDCGETGSAYWQGQLNCWGGYDCDVEVGEESISGLCLGGNSYSGAGKELCLSWEDVCEATDCGDFRDPELGERAERTCHGNYTCGGPETACLNSVCRSDFARTEFGELGCRPYDSSTCGLVCESGGKYGLCDLDGNCVLIDFGEYVDCAYYPPTDL